MKKRVIVSELLTACFGVASVILTLCCFATAFGLDFSAWTVALVCAVSGLLVWGASRIIPRPFGVPAATTSAAAAAAFTAFFSLGELNAQLNYAVNGFLRIYHRVYSVFPESLFFAEDSADNVTLLFSVIGLVFCAAAVLSLCRARVFFPTLLLSLLLLVPCFITVDSPPEPLCFVMLVAVLLSLYVSSFARRRTENGGFALAVSFCAVAALSLIITSIFPYEKYERYLWQDELLGVAEELTGVGTDFGEAISPLEGLKASASQTVDLRREGRRTLTHVPVLKALSESGGRLYLRGVSYANYADSKWSLLDREQQAAFPQDYDFLFSGSASGEPKQLSVITERRSELCYTPYFCTALSEGMSPVLDVGVKNEKGVKSYDFEVLSADEIGDAQLSRKYIDYVEQNYLSLPEQTEELMSGFIDAEGLYEATEGEEDYYRAAAEAVRRVVSSRGHYALECERVPADKDFAFWFLTEAESGYCVHYAAAATVLLRAMGVPARYVTGYCADVTAGRWTTVTTDNAHAWAEYFDEERGWCVLDATPPDFSPSQYEPTQPTTAAGTREAVPRSTEAPTKPAPERSGGGSKAPWQLVIPFAAVTALILIIILKTKITDLIRRRGFTVGSRDDRARYAYRYLLRLSGRTGIAVPQELEDIASKARFSDRHVTEDELEAICGYAKKQRDELYRSAAPLKKLYCRIILGL